jgi:hypothetical protein
VSAKALHHRVARTLARKGLTIRATRGKEARALGAYHIISDATGQIIAWASSLHELANELGLLAPHETLNQCASGT